MEPDERELRALDRGRRTRALTVAGLLVASAVVAVLLVVDTERGASPARWVAVGTLAVLNLAYGTAVIARERAAARTTGELVATRAAVAAERARERALEVAHVAARSLAASLELAEVAERAAAAAGTVVEASGAELALHVRGELATAATWGTADGRPGQRRRPDAAERPVLADGEAQVVGRGGAWGDGPPTALVPVALPDRIVGLLTVSRGATSRPFTEADRLALSLLAEHIALALRNATRYDRVQQRADALAAAFGELAEDLDGPA